MMMGAGVGMVGMVAFWGLLIWAAIQLSTRSPIGGAPREESAREILQRRFARGEIDRDELESRSRALQDR